MVIDSPRPLRVAILHVTPSNFVGGYERFASRLAQDLSDVGIETDQVTTASILSHIAYVLTTIGRPRQAIVYDKAEVSWTKARARLRCADCIYVKNDPIDLAVATLLARNKPMVIGMHSSLDIPRVDWGTGLRRAVRRSWVYRRLLIGRRRLYHCLYPPPVVWNLPSSQIRIVPNPINRNRLVSRASSKKQRFLFVGRLNRDKGADLLCGLAERLINEPDTELVVVGDGEYADSMRQQAGIRYYPYRSDIKALMRASSWLLMPSRWEQQPLVLLEAIEETLPYVIGPAPELERLRLDDGLVMKAATVESIHQCCLEAIKRGRSQVQYDQVVSKVAQLADAWPKPTDTLNQMASVLAEAARLGDRSCTDQGGTPPL